MPRAALATSEGFLERAFHFNVTAPFTLTKLAARRWWTPPAAGGGQHLVRWASMTQTGFAAYSAVEGGLDRLTRNMAPELAPRVRLNAIDVGGVATRSLDIVLPTRRCAPSFWPKPRWAARASPRTSPAPPLPGVRRQLLGHRQGVRDRWGHQAPAMAVPAPPLEPAGGLTAPA